MLSLLNNVDLPSGEWLLVIGVGLVFFLVQLILSTSFGFRLRRQERAIRRLQREFDAGGAGRPNLSKVAKSNVGPLGCFALSHRGLPFIVEFHS